MQFEDVFNAKVTPLNNLPEILHQKNDENRILFESILSLDRPVSQSESQTESTDIHRLEKKIDAVLLLLNDLVLNSQPDFIPTRITLKPEGVNLNESVNPENCPFLELQLYLLPWYPKPAVFWLVKQDEPGDYLFSGMDTDVQELYQRILFRFHRREIHQKRSASPEN